MSAPAAERHAEVMTGFVAALAITLADLAGIVRRPPVFPSTVAAQALFVLVGAALGGLVGAGFLVTRGLFQHAVRRWGSAESALCGALDGAVLYTLGVWGADPKALEGDARACLLAAVLVGAALLHAAARRLPALGPVMGGVAVGLGAWLLEGLHWQANDWSRAALHLVLAAGLVSLLRRPLARACGRISSGVAIALAVMTVVASGSLLDASREVRRTLHLESSHVHTWYYFLERLVDRDGDEATHVLGGADCDPSRASVSPVASEVPGDGIDQNCAGGDGAASPAPPASRAHGAGRGSDVVVLSIDAFRWDMLDALPRTLAAVGPHAAFGRAVSPAPKTIAALTAVMRGRPCRSLQYAAVPGIRSQVLARDSSPTLAHVLTRAGYRAITVPTHPYLESDYGVSIGWEELEASGYLARKTHLGTARFGARYLPATDALSIAREAARETPGALALWVHLMDTHASKPDDPAAMRRDLASVDPVIARFLEELAAVRGRPRLTVLFGDHGEEYREHGGTSHASNVHAEQVRVPLLLAGAGVPPGRYDAPVSTAAIASTVLDVVGLPTPATMREPSLLGPLHGEMPWPAIAVSEVRFSGRTLVGYTGERYRLVSDPVHRVDALFDSRNDALERRDLSARRPDVLARMRRLARAWDERH